MKLSIFFLLSVAILLFGCITEENTPENFSPMPNNSGEIMKFVELKDYVEVEYTGTLDDGTIFDSNVGGKPLGFTAGAGQMIKGFDNAVIGMKEGEEKKIHLEPEEAYGSSDPELIMEFPLEELPEGIQLGSILYTQTGAQGTVKKLTNETATIDFNHKFAGVPLNFKIKILKIEKNSQ
ncbi:MAG: peptidylprolyl isomerase [Candidatus ainarchaeum sp.]|nr:peptidylprolyl isomerase [Candidatus ainarchaeum sp.]